jgi:hypothetical protein
MAKRTTAKKAIGVGVGVAAAAAALGAGAYYFFGSKQAAKHRKTTARWANDLKKDVVRGVKKAKKLDEAAYRAIVDEASKAYATISDIDRSDLEAAARELRENFKAVKREITRVAKKDTKVVSKAAKGVAKKVSKAAKKVSLKAKPTMTKVTGKKKTKK